LPFCDGRSALAPGYGRTDQSVDGPARPPQVEQELVRAAAHCLPLNITLPYTPKPYIARPPQVEQELVVAAAHCACAGAGAGAYAATLQELLRPLPPALAALRAAASAAAAKSAGCAHCQPGRGWVGTAAARWRLGRQARPCCRCCSYHGPGREGLHEGGNT